MRSFGELVSAATAGPTYPANAQDERTVGIAGLDLPVRASVAIAVVTFALLFDYSRTLLPTDLAGAPRSPDGVLAISILRFILLGLVPLAVVTIGFHDHPSRYGLTLGDWRWGLPLAVAGCVVMTPVVVWFASLPGAHAFYAEFAAVPVGQLIAGNALELTASEFAFRGFLMLTLVRVVGPIGVLLATMPFVFAHLGKPELELFSTLGGGLAYGWLAWRTRSIVWGSIAHTWILTLVAVAARS